VNVLDLFSGIGGMSLGLERAGMRTVAFCEIDPYCRRVLARHWPGVPIYDDVRTLTAARLAADGVVRPDLIAGGFPCQDISVAGKGGGIGGARSGLWFEFHRLIAEIRPAWAFIENVPALRSRGLDQVLGGLDALGFDAEWDCVPASALGAHHRRDRLWIVAYGDSGQRIKPFEALSPGRDAIGSGCQGVADTDGPRLEIQFDGPPGQRPPALGTFAGALEPGLGGMADGLPSRLDGASDRSLTPPASASMWAEEPDIPRVARGVPHRVARLRALGNAVVPQVVEILGRRIMAAARAQAPTHPQEDTPHVP